MGDSADVIVFAFSGQQKRRENIYKELVYSGRYKSHTSDRPDRSGSGLIERIIICTYYVAREMSIIRNSMSIIEHSPAFIQISVDYVSTALALARLRSLDPDAVLTHHGSIIEIYKAKMDIVNLLVINLRRLYGISSDSVWLYGVKNMTMRQIKSSEPPSRADVACLWCSDDVPDFIADFESRDLVFRQAILTRWLDANLESDLELPYWLEHTPIPHCWFLDT